MLTELERDFVTEYLKDGDGRRAALAVGYVGPSPLKGANEMLEKEHVIEEIHRQYQLLVNDLHYGAEEYHRRLIQETEADVADLFDETTGQLRSIHQWPRIWRQGLITDIDVSETAQGDTRVLKIKLADRTKRLEMLGKHKSVKAFVEVQDLNVTGDINSLLTGIKPTLDLPMHAYPDKYKAHNSADQLHSEASPSLTPHNPEQNRKH